MPAAISGDGAPQPRTRLAGVTPAGPAVSVATVIVTFRRPDSLLRTLAAARAQTRAPDAFYVVDNGADDEVEALLSQAEPAAHYVAMPENMGYAAGLAAGMDRSCDAGHDYVWLLDDDSTPVDSALERCLAVASEVPRCGLVGLSGGTMSWGVPLHRPASEVGSAVEGQAGAYRCDFALVDGAVVPTEAIRRIGHPRADFFMMMEDVEYSGRLRRAGLEVVVVTDPLIERRHLGSGGGEGDGRSPPWRGYYQTRNHLIMAIEHRSAPELMGWLVRQVRLVWGTLLQGDRRAERIRLRALGAWHGFRGIRGRTVEPG